MTVLVDTSVWVDYFRGKNEGLRRELDRLLDEDDVAIAAPVRIEILLGVPPAMRGTLARLLAALPTHRPQDTDWDTMEEWAIRAGEAGHRFAIGDLAIASVAARLGIAVWSLDKDFERMSALDFVRMHRP